LGDKMLRITRADKVNQVVTLKWTKSNLEEIVESVVSMSDKQQRTLLENVASEDHERQKLDNYKALKEDLRKILQILIY
jgi:hypothetical protein